MEYIEVDVASATFLLFKVLYKKKNEEIVCLWIPAASISLYAFSHVSPVNKSLDIKYSIIWFVFKKTLLAAV